MKNKTVYIFPAIIDLLVGTFFFVSMVRMAQSGASAMAVSALMAVWGVTYMVACPIAGRLVTRENSIALLVGSSAGMACCAGIFLVFPQMQMLYVIMALFGATVAFFFPPFQFFMKNFSADGNQGLAYSAAIYTVSWSLGLGAGPFISGYLWTWAGWQWICVLDIVLALATVAGILAMARGQRGAGVPVGDRPSGKLLDYSGRPDMVVIAWIGAGAFLLVLAMVRAVFPSSAAADQISKTHQGNVLALICLGQAVAAYLLRNGTQWFYRPVPVAAAGVVGLAGLAAFGFAHTWSLYYLASLCLGACSGIIFIYLVFHALVHPTRAGRYAGINESIVGLTGIIGPLAGGMVADQAGLSAPYFWAMALYGAVLVVQVFVHARVGKGSS